jgi:hypothetical protein
VQTSSFHCLDVNRHNKMDARREFAAEREIHKSGDSLTIRLMMRTDSKSLTIFFRNQGVGIPKRANGNILI